LNDFTKNPTSPKAEINFGEKEAPLQGLGLTTGAKNTIYQIAQQRKQRLTSAGKIRDVRVWSLQLQWKPRHTRSNPFEKRQRKATLQWKQRSTLARQIATSAIRACDFSVKHDILDQTFRDTPAKVLFGPNSQGTAL